MNATGEYLLLELGAVLRLRMALLFLCWPRQDAIFSAGSGTRHLAKKCAAQRVWEYMLGLCMEKCDFESASSLTWFGVVGRARRAAMSSSYSCPRNCRFA